MTITRPEIRQFMLDRDFFDGWHGTATAGAARSITDTTLLQTGSVGSTRVHASKYLYRPAANNAEDTTRRITSTGYSPAKGILQNGGPDYTENPLAGTDDGYYEVWPYLPAMVNRAISRALISECFALQIDDFTTNGQSRYEVGAAPVSLTSLTSANQLFEIEQVTGTEPNATSSPWKTRGRTWLPEWDEDTLYLRFSPKPSGTLRLHWKLPYPDLTDETTTSTVDVDFVGWASMIELFSALARRAVRRREDPDEFVRLHKDAYAMFDVERRKVMERFGSEFHMPSPRWRTGVRGVQMGRSGGRLGGAGGRTV